MTTLLQAIHSRLRLRRVQYAATDHAPAGGATAGGKAFTGGEFVPRDAGGGGKGKDEGTGEAPVEQPTTRGDVTQSPAFKTWFADSKVVDAEGKPLRVFHGTTDKFDTFDADRSALSPRGQTGPMGFFFTPDPKGSGHYATSQGSIIPVYLAIKNPAHVTEEEYRDATNSRADARRFRESLQAKGHDGAWVENQNEWIAFSPHQIKSATGNRGTFDPTSARIDYAQAESLRQRLRRVLYENGRLLSRVEYAAKSTPLVSHPVTGKLVSEKSRSGDPKCSQAASEWRRKQPTSQTHKILAMCRAAAKGLLQASQHRAAGSEAKAQSLESRVKAGKPLGEKERGVKAKEAQGKLDSKRIERADKATKEKAPKSFAGPKGVSLPTRLTQGEVEIDNRQDDPSHQSLLHLARTLTGLEGDGPRTGYSVRENAYSGARAYARDQYSVVYDKTLADAYHAAMDKPPSQWNIEDARAVSAVIHEYTHTVGISGSFSGEANEYLEEASTELLARHATDQILEHGGADKAFREEFNKSGAYNSEVLTLRLLADATGTDPVELARTLKNTDTGRRENARLQKIGELLGATGDNRHKQEFGDGFNHYIGGGAQLDRIISGYDPLSEGHVERYRAQVNAFRMLAKEITPEVSKRIIETFNQHGGHINVDWSRPMDTLQAIRNELKNARRDVKDEAHGEWARENQARAKAKIESVKGLKSLTNPAILKAFYVK